MPTDNNLNLDPISKEPGSHPVGTGIGAAAGGAAAGAAAGVIAGPVGAVVGAVIGAVAGGMGGKAAAEAINPTAEEAYWKSSYDKEPYYQQGRAYEDYAPAYRMGMHGPSEYGGRFSDAEPSMATNWESRRETSALSWPEASAASRAAWDRVDNSQGQSASYGSSDGMGATSRNSTGTLDKDDVVDTLNDLLECCRDGEYGFRECAGYAQETDVKSLLSRRAEDCRSGGLELQNLIRQYGGETDDGGTVAGAMHRGWVSVKGTLSGHSTQAMLDECERGEDAALARYRKALKRNLPADVMAVVTRQQEGVQRNHDQIKAVRDAHRAQSS
ncbi:MAG: family four-helix-bundle protein [Polaromonas sp.]|jgi:uncharacterized protein (TIGR02284 family)|nr:family four-helix-bundle protein [Polaromonas sp.]